jgi:hypothetical protein
MRYALPLSLAGSMNSDEAIEHLRENEAAARMRFMAALQEANDTLSHSGMLIERYGAIYFVPAAIAAELNLDDVPWGTVLMSAAPAVRHVTRRELSHLLREWQRAEDKLTTADRRA